MKIGFIGAGNMGGAIIRGLKGMEICLHDADGEKGKALAAETGAMYVDNNREVVKNSCYVVLAVKPDMYRATIHEVRGELLSKRCVVISIAAGISLETLEEMLGTDGVPVVRVMPNVNASVLEAVSGICHNKNVTDKELQHVKDVFNSIGRAVEMEERLFPAYTAIGGCAPAFAFLFIDALANAAVKQGIPKKKAVEIAAQALYGSAKLALLDKENPWGLIERVCSPGGTTIEGVLTLEEKGFISAITAAVEATIAKDNALSGKLKI